ncbi:MAG: hypothetical protein K2M44_05920 [Clostridia bacterium]|nr:hypothetical protein [Clostridia bacterium]
MSKAVTKVRYAVIDGKKVPHVQYKTDMARLDRLISAYNRACRRGRKI